MRNIDRYEAAVQVARRRFHTEPAVRTLTDAGSDPVVLEAFLIYYSALGVGMTEPVEGWIRRAGQRCVEMGIDKLGTALQAHAKSEADHHLLMIDDLHRLCARWNGTHSTRLEPEQLLALPRCPSTERYCQLHEDVIDSVAPYAQIAIENEIELLSLHWGKPLLDNCRQLLGDDIGRELSFLDEHVTLDVGHTNFNRRQMADFLTDRPEAVTPLVNAGADSLDAYGEFLADCVELATATAAQTR